MCLSSPPGRRGTLPEYYRPIVGRGCTVSDPVIIDEILAQFAVSPHPGEYAPLEIVDSRIFQVTFL
jgi:hypothetical protein